MFNENQIQKIRESKKTDDKLASLLHLPVRTIKVIRRGADDPVVPGAKNETKAKIRNRFLAAWEKNKKEI